MKILTIETVVPGIKQNDYQPHLKEEALKAWELYHKGIIREFYFTKDHSAVLILECLTEEEADKYLNTLHLVKEGLIKFNIISLLPYTGFTRLFNNVNKIDEKN
jgi:hypothetical protein